MGKVGFPFIRLASEFLRTINSGDLPWKERLRCYGHFRRWLWTYSSCIVEDLIDGLQVTIKKRLSEEQIKRMKYVRGRFRRLLPF